MTDVDPLVAALRYAATGWRVIPVPPGGKRPKMTAWQDKASTDHDTITDWWTRSWRGAGVGIATGSASGIWVLDVDVANGKSGDATLAALEARHGALPDTVEVVTGSGGRHLYFAWPDFEIRNDRAKRLGHGLDVRGEGGQVVAPPTRHCDTGTPYRFAPGRSPAETAVAPTPGWLADLLRPPPPPERPSRVDLLEGLLGDVDSPAAWFAQRYSWADLLEADGWTLAGTVGDEQRWTRPGKHARQGISATVGHDGRDVLKVFTSSVPGLEAEAAYSRFGYFAATRHRGDRSAAARHIRVHMMPRPERDDLAWAVPPGVDPATGEIRPEPPAAPWPTLPAEFWAARPLFGAIRDAAHARNRSADAVFHAVLVRVAACTPHHWMLPPIVGAPAPLNLFGGIVGPAGSGKSTAVAIAVELVSPPEGITLADNLPLGSGEGIAEAFMGWVSMDDEDGKKHRVHTQTRYNAFFSVDEGKALVDHMARRGSTVAETLRRAWSGATLGQKNASADRERIVPAGNYRLSMMIGFQPGVAAELMDDADGGTPQRFLWCASIDPTIAQHSPGFPERLEIPMLPSHTVDSHETSPIDGFRRHFFGVDPAIATEIRAHDLAANRGELEDPDPLDAHGMLQRLKVAAVLAVIDGRMDITGEDWRLAGIIWDTSRAVRARIVRLAQVAAELEEQGRIARHVRREIAGGGAEAKVERFARRIARWVHDQKGRDDFSRNDLKNRLKAVERDFFDEALGYALGEGWLIDDDDRFLPGESRPA